LFRDVDYVFHQAAIPSVQRSVENPITNDVNVNGTLNVLIAARDSEVEKVVYASSSSVYGDTPELPKREEMKPNPKSPCAVSKLTGEKYCRVFFRGLWTEDSMLEILQDVVKANILAVEMDVEGVFNILLVKKMGREDLIEP